MDKLTALLVKHEGLRLFPYKDTVGKLTIGVGHNLTDLGITEEMAYAILNRDVEDVIADLKRFPWWDSLNETRQMALADMRFNLGPTKFRGFKNTLKAISEGRWNDAAKGMLASKWAKQVGQRALDLAQMIKDGK